MIRWQKRRNGMGAVSRRMAGAGAGLLLGATLAAAASASGPAQAAAARTADCGEAVARRVQKHYEAIRDLAARFEQRTDSAALGSATRQALIGHGTVVFAKPGRLRWTYEAPEPSVVVSDGESVWIYDPTAREAQHLPLSGGFLSGAAIQFLLGSGDLLQQFEVRAASCDESPVRLVLAPRADAPYERLEVRADPNSGQVSETWVADLLGNVTHVRFLEIRTNRDPGAEVFRFEPPEGVKVLELPAS